MSSKFEIKMLLCQNTLLPFEITTIISDFVGKNKLTNKKFDETLYLTRNNFRCRHKHLWLYDFSVN